VLSRERRRHVPIVVVVALTANTPCGAVSGGASAAGCM
jgi:hypothetical protein